MTILVAMPYYGCPELVGRAVASVLAQSHLDLRLLVIGDGETPPVESDDPRLSFYVLSENHGPYFALQLALLASPYEWIAPFGADDWAESDHLAQLARKHVDAVITGAVFTNSGREHHGPYEVGLFRRRRLLAMGGWNPAERIGQDTLTMRILKITGSFGVTERATYHRVKRKGSLTTDPATGLGSPARRAVRARNRAVFTECVRLGNADAIRAYRASLVPRHISLELASHVLSLSEQLMVKAA